MSTYLSDGDVKALINLARSLPELPVLDALAAVGQLGRAVDPLGVELLSLRQRVQGDALNFERYARTVAAKDTELKVAYAKIDALEKRVATLAAA
jgi:hypothetical protein